ncbi:MAG TPA: hypothetical protein VFL83_11185 [Anaeromyxobacter sp.]|nr:hypothetical protein [Anaeromyxobacter sp.]
MVKVGGEVDALCSRCELVLAHTVHAVVAGQPVKVECNTCHTVHRFRAPAGRPAGRAPGVRAPRAPRAAAVGFDELLASKDQASVQQYSPARTYAEGAVVDHPLFGRGFVSAVRDGGKIEVTFRSSVKILVHARR